MFLQGWIEFVLQISYRETQAGQDRNKGDSLALYVDSIIRIIFIEAKYIRQRYCNEYIYYSRVFVLQP